MTQYFKKNKTAIHLETAPFASGGEGAVHRILNMSGYCAKIYHPDQLTKKKEKKIEYLINNFSYQQLSDKALICWPVDLVYNTTGKFVGFIMPLSFQNSIELYEIVTLKIRNNLDNKWKKKFDRNTIDGIQNRLKVCVNIAIALHTLHSTRHYVLVDFKPQNILITTDGRVSITDMDSIQVFNNSQIIHHAKVATPEYAPKESEKLNPANDLITETWDRFSLAVVFYEILFGIHPYAATAGGQYDNATTIDDKIRKNLFVHGSKKSYLTVIPQPHSNYNNLPTSIKNLFIKAFETGSTNPLLRPTAEEWGKTITEELKSLPITYPPTKPPNNDFIKILSNPSGATVFNSTLQEIGITPCFLDKSEYLYKTLKVTHGNKFTTIFIDKNSSQIYAHLPLSDNTNQDNGWLKVVLFVVTFTVLAIIGIGTSNNNSSTSTETTDSTSVVVDTTAAADTAAATADILTNNYTNDAAIDTAAVDTAAATSASNNYTAEEISKIFLLALNKADCETAWQVTYNPVWEAKGKAWFCSSQAFGGVNKVDILEIIEISNDGLKAVVYVKYYAEDIYNGNGNYTQYFELKYNGTNWYIVKVRNAP